MTGTELVRYDAMCRAISDAYEVDEVKEIRDKAVAMEAYFRQAKNPEPERRACEIRLRAERKAGQLRREEEKINGRPKSSPMEGEVLTNARRRKQLGISKKQDEQWQALAAIPEEQFEAALAGPDKPSTNGIIAKPKQQPMSPKALWLWGRLRDFESEGILDHSQDDLLWEMTDGMRADVLRLSRLVAEWLDGVREQ